MPTIPKQQRRAYMPERVQQAQRQGQEIAQAFYQSNRWKKASYLFKIRNPLCARCAAKGITTPTQVTNHVIPMLQCSDPMDESNWEPLCTPCHDLDRKAQSMVNHGRVSHKDKGEGRFNL